MWQIMYVFVFTCYCFCLAIFIFSLKKRTIFNLCQIWSSNYYVLRTIITMYYVHNCVLHDNIFISYFALENNNYRTNYTWIPNCFNGAEICYKIKIQMSKYFKFKLQLTLQRSDILQQKVVWLSEICGAHATDQRCLLQCRSKYCQRITHSEYNFCPHCKFSIQQNARQCNIYHYNIGHPNMFRCYSTIFRRS